MNRYEEQQKIMNDGGPAFARPYFENLNGSEYSTPQAGMSLRDWFAGMALSGVIVHDDTYDVAEAAYAIADAMLAARGTK